MMFFRKLYIYIPFLAILAFSCNSYEKLLKSNDYDMKYAKAIEFYNEGEYVKAQALLEQIQPVFTATRTSDTIAFYNAKCNYYLGDYILAAYYFEVFSETFNNAVFTEEADFLNAYCYYLASPDPELDQENTYRAINAIRAYLTKHPESERAAECNELLHSLHDKLVKKEYYSAKLYYNLGYYKAAIIALNNCLSKFPDTSYREELLFLILKSKFLLAENSIISKQKERYQASLDEYYSFISEFSDGEYKKESEKIYQIVAKKLNIAI